MIVKNEAHIITRCLDSMRPYIDIWAICDTGSNDGTPEIIQNYFERYQIPGKLYHTEWRNFGYNRSLAISFARNKADFLLLMDADFILRPTHQKPIDLDWRDSLDINVDAYLISYTGTIAYRQLLLVNGKHPWYYHGRTHEHLSLPHGSPKARTEVMQDFQIEHPGDGGNKSTKFQRDISLLLQDWEEYPNVPRTAFYLAQSYTSLKDWDRANKWYLRRIELGKDPQIARNYQEEVYYSMYMLARIKLFRSREVQSTNKESESADTESESTDKSFIIQDFLRAYQYRPKRLEALYEAIKLARESGEYALGFQYGLPAKNTPYPSGDQLFVNRPIHEYLFLGELLCCAYQTGKQDIVQELLPRVLAFRQHLSPKYLHQLHKLQDSTPNQKTQSNIKPFPTLPKMSLDQYQLEIIAQNQSLRDPIKQQVLILGNFATFNLNRGLSNNRIKFLHHLALNPPPNVQIWIQSTSEKDFLFAKDLSLGPLLQQFQPDLILYYLMGTTDLQLGNPFQDWSTALEQYSSLVKGIWIEDVQYLSSYAEFIREHNFTSIILGVQNPQIYRAYQKSFPNKSVFQLEQYLDTSVFQNWNLVKEWDILMYGCCASSLYPFRARLYQILQKLSQESDLRIKIIEHPGYNNSKVAGTSVSRPSNAWLVNQELSQLINQSYLTVCTKSKADLLLKKYVETGLSGSIILGDFPSGYSELHQKLFMVYLNPQMSDSDIIRTIKGALQDRVGLQAAAQRNLALFSRFSYQSGTQRVNEIIGSILSLPGQSRPSLRSSFPPWNPSLQTRYHQVSPRLQLYYPSGVQIPSEWELRRELREDRQHLNNKPLTQEDLQEYDSRTIFYDVVWNYQRTKIIILGPAMLNLGTYLSAVKISLSYDPEFSQSYTYTLKVSEIQSEHSGLSSKITITPPRRFLPSRTPDLQTPPLYLQLIFHKLQDWTQVIRLDSIYPVTHSSRNTCTPTTTDSLKTNTHININLVTMQKNNPIKWIQDWIRYYYNHGITKLTLYDNNSENRENQLIPALQELLLLLPNLNILVVRWDYLYGPSRSNPNQFSQTTALLHSALSFTDPEEWLLNLDIDEYVMHREELSIREYVQQIQHKSAESGTQASLIYLDSYNVFNITWQEDPKLQQSSKFKLEQRSIIDFPYREKLLRGYNLKYLCRAGQIRFCGPHDVVGVPDSETISASDSPLYFLHYLGLSTGWKPSEKRNMIHLFSSQKLQPDLSTHQWIQERRLEYTHSPGKFQIYVPKSLRLPKGYPISRELLHSDECQLSDSDLKKYDRRTIFYDIFLENNSPQLTADSHQLVNNSPQLTADSHQIMADCQLCLMGPPMGSLEPYLLDFEVQFLDPQDQKRQSWISLTSRKIEKSNVRIIVRYSVPASASWGLQIRICFPKLPGFEYQTWIAPIDNYCRQSQLTLSTLQKENHMIWIKDWIEYYNLQGVDQVILYDNGSQNRETDLIPLLQSLSQRLKIPVTLVFWDFPYGPSRSSKNQFAQPGSLTHAALSLAHSAEWMINADIDELMYLRAF